MFGYVLRGNTREEKNSEFGDKEKEMHLEDEKSGIRKHEARPARMLLFKNFGFTVGGEGLPVGSHFIELSAGNSRKKESPSGKTF